MGSTRSLLLKILLPVALGLGAVVWLFLREFDAGAWQAVTIGGRGMAAIGMAVLFMCLREACLAWRFHVLSDGTLGWLAALRVTILCEFTSAITPTTAGGSAMSMVFMKREGVDLGRGTTLMMTTLFLDEFFNVVLCPFIFLIAPYTAIFGFNGGFSSGVRISFWIVIGLITAITALLFWGTLGKPEAVRAIIRKLFSWRLLRRWRKRAETSADEMVAAGHDFRHRPLRWWLRSFAATAGLWISRFLVVNALFWGFAAGADQLVVFARQFVVWTLLTVSPTPGGSGLSEWLFTNYYGDMLHDASVALVIAVFWRLITYYSVLTAGAIMLPSYLRNLNKHTR